MPKIIHPLSKEDDQRIKRNWMFLKTNLVEDEIRDIFLVEAIWDLCDFQKIDAEKTPEEKNEMFLKLLLQSGTRAYKVFIAGLQENYAHIVEQLQQTPITEAPLEPSEFPPLSDADAQRIIHNWTFLKKNLVQDEIRDFFIIELIWDLDCIEEIDAEKTPKKKNEKFLKLLLKSGHIAFEIFIAALREKCSTHILEKLQNTPTTIPADAPYGSDFENALDRDILENWQQEDALFVPTKSSRNVENMIESQNLVIVAGHSGSGKSAMTQHIALKYRRKGWVVKPVDTVEEIRAVYASGKFQSNNTIFVLHDPIGKESYNEILYTSWKKYEPTLKVSLRNVKLLLTSRIWILSDKRVKDLDLVNKETIFIIDNQENKLSDEEKKQIFQNYISIADDQYEKLAEVFKIETSFPLLCKLFARNKESLENVSTFFKEPIDVVKKEIEIWKEKDPPKYGALVCLVLFKNVFCVSDMMNNNALFKKCLNLCGLPECTSAATVKNNLESLEGYFVKKIGNTYHFYHDFIMEVTTFVFGTEYPEEIIKNADIGFLRRRVKLEKSANLNDSFAINVSDIHINCLVERFLTELVGNRFMEVVLNPCVRNDEIVDKLIDKITNNKKTLKEMKKEKEYINTEKNIVHKKTFFSRFDFLEYMGEFSPLFALIVFRHDKLSLFCLKLLREKKKNKKKMLELNLLPAVCCNGSMDLFHVFLKEEIEMSLKKHHLFKGHPVEIASEFHNHEILNELLGFGIVNLKKKYNFGYTPLHLAVANQATKISENDKHNNLKRQNETIQSLIDNGGDVNLCTETGLSPLHMACENGNDSTVQLLLNNGADVNLCTETGSSPLFIACEYGHNSVVELLLNNRSDLNLCEERGASPLLIACQNGHDSTVQLLLNNGADVNLCTETGSSPLFIACQSGHNSVVQLLLNNGADVNLCMETGLSPLFIACQIGHNSVVQLLLNNGADVNLCTKTGLTPLYVACYNGHYSVVQLLIYNGADVNLCEDTGFSPLYVACHDGHDSIVRLLLKNGAYVNLCTMTGFSPLHLACQNGHDSTVQLVLNYGAGVNLCTETGSSPLFIACQNDQNTVVQLLLNNCAYVNLCEETGSSPLYIACQNGNNSVVQLLLNNCADVDLCTETGSSPLLIACQNGHNTIVQLLLNNGANVNLCEETGSNPLYIACQNGHHSVVQLLLNNGADVNLCTETGSSPLFIACQNGHHTVVQLLLNNGADVNLCEETGVSPFYVACQYGHNSVVQLLLNIGADVNLCKSTGASPLYFACQNGHDGTVQLLLNNGADVNLSDERGASPLLIASQKGRNSVVQLLLNNGADVNLCTKTGLTPIFIACQNGHDGTVQLLLNNGADVNLCDERGVSPFLIACQKGHDSVVQLLLNNGADVNLIKKKDEDGIISPLCSLS
uniref:Ankyrin-3-like isoform X2 n=1 Tax=Crassostrea virginica TaxID=6565 RepID=A0A8B8ACT9_CRAVI|nr:ankyrin-3-like isoform X2 [Crassostrea virginica]